MELGSLAHHFADDALGLQLVAEKVAAGAAGDGRDLRDPLRVCPGVQGASEETAQRLEGLAREAQRLAPAALRTDEAGSALVEEQGVVSRHRPAAAGALRRRREEAR